MILTMDSILDYLASQSDRVTSQAHKNAMELLVAEEIQAQLESYSAENKELINEVEIATYALNRLPSLYASSEEGLIWQRRRAQKELQEQITQTVRDAIEVVVKDPARFSTPLLSPEETEIQEAKEALQELLDWLWLYQSELPQRTISWRELTDLVKQIIDLAVNQEANVRKMQKIG